VNLKWASISPSARRNAPPISGVLRAAWIVKVRCTSVTYIIRRIFVGIQNSDSFIRLYDAYLEFIVFTYNICMHLYEYIVQLWKTKVNLGNIFTSWHKLSFKHYCALSSRCFIRKHIHSYMVIYLNLILWS